MISTSLGVLVLVNGCAGVADNEALGNGAGRGGASGDGGRSDGTSSNGDAAGSRDAGGGIDPCMVPLANKSCNLAGCHAATMTAAGLRLTEDVIAQPSALVDRANTGDPGGCGAGMFKLIDRSEPEKSLLYRKVSSLPPCGAKMPVGPALSASETACVLSWIKSAIRP